MIGNNAEDPKIQICKEIKESEKYEYININKSKTNVYKMIVEPILCWNVSNILIKNKLKDWKYITKVEHVEYQEEDLLHIIKYHNQRQKQIIETR